MITNIQALRAYAAIIVVLYHSVGLASDYGFEYGNLGFLTFNVEHWGSVGVDIFFVISGYIMFMINNKRQQSPTEFIINRIKRIVPIYWLLVLSITVIFYIAPSIFRSLSLDITYILSSLFFISRYFGYEYPVLYVGWTLEYEMFFYLIFAILLFNRKISQNFQISLMLLVFIISFYLNINKTIVFEFIYGGVIYIILNKYDLINKYGKNNFYWLIIILSSFYLAITPSPSESTRYLLWGIPSLLIFTSLLFVREIKIKFISHLGDASYSIYLIQVFTLPLIAKIFTKIIPNINAIYIFLLSSIFTIYIGYIFYILVERNINVLISKK